MVNPAWVTLAAAQVHGSPVKVGTVIGFPLGANLTVTKLAEAEAAAQNGAHELDMVINIGALKSGDRVLVQTEIRSLVETGARARCDPEGHHRDGAAEPGGEDPGVCPRGRSGSRLREDFDGIRCFGRDSGRRCAHARRGGA